MPKIAFFEIKPEEQKYIEENLSKKDYLLLFFPEKFSFDLLKDHRDVEGISVFVGSRLDAESVKGFAQLKLVTTRSTGFDHIDVKTLAKKNIRIGYVPGYGDNTVAEFAFGLLLAVVRKIPFAFYRIRTEGKFSHEGCQGFDLMGKTLGVVGTGRIGKHMIRIANGFGMKVMAYDLKPDRDLSLALNFQYVSLDELLSKADVVSLHVPYFEKTHHLINEESFAKMKQGAIFINTSRGAVVDTAALLRALQTGKLAGAGLDVLEGEEKITDEMSYILYGRTTEQEVKTLAANLILAHAPNVVMTPHIAFYTREALQRILNTDIQNIVSFFATGKLVYDVMASKRVMFGSSSSSAPQSGGGA